MERTRIWIVVAHYTTIKHNNVTPDDDIKVFSSLHRAMEYVRGTDGNGSLLKDRLNVWLKEGATPKFDLYPSGKADIAFKVDTECLYESALKQGGYLDKVEIIESELR